MAPDTHRQLLSSLISQSLISVLAGMNKIDVASKILKAIRDLPVIGAEDKDISDIVSYG